MTGASTPAAIRARYAAKLRNPRDLLRLVRGQVSPGKLKQGLWRALRPAPASTTLAREMAAALAAFNGPVQILLAQRDRTAQAFIAAWDADDARLRRCDNASHAFVEEQARMWLEDRILETLGAFRS